MVRESAKVAQEKEVIERRKHRKSRDAAARLFKPILDQIIPLNSSGMLKRRLPNGRIGASIEIAFDREHNCAVYSYPVGATENHHVSIWVETRMSLEDFGSKIKWLTEKPRYQLQILVGDYHKNLEVYLADYLLKYPLLEGENPFVFAFGSDTKAAMKKFADLIAENGACIVDK